MKLSNILKKDARKINNKVKPFEKDPLTYNHHERLVILGGTMLLLSLYGKYVSLKHWYSIDFDLSSYPPISALLAVAGTSLAFLYAYYKEDKVLETIALIGLGVALIFSMGIIHTYYYTLW